MTTSGHWISSAIKHPGSFSAKAKKARMSVKRYARIKKSSSDTKLARQANLALTLEKLRGK